MVAVSSAQIVPPETTTRSCCFRSPSGLSLSRRFPWTSSRASPASNPKSEAAAPTLGAGVRAIDGSLAERAPHPVGAGARFEARHVESQDEKVVLASGAVLHVIAEQRLR